MHFIKLFFLICVVNSFANEGCMSVERFNQFDSNLKSNDSISIYIAQSKDRENDKHLRIIYARKAYDLSKKVNNDSIQIVTSLNLAWQYYNQNYLNLFKKFSNESLEKANRGDNDLGLAISYDYLGLYHQEVKKLDSAYYYYSKSVKFYDKLGNDENTGFILLTMAIIQKNEKDYIGSEITTVNSIEYFMKTNNYRNLAVAYNNLGIVANELENFEEAIKKHSKALAYKKKWKPRNRYSEINSLNNIGVVYEHKGDYEKAIEFYDRALMYKNLEKDAPLIYARLLDNITYAKFKNQSQQDLYPDYKKALAIRDSMEDIAGLITNNLHLAEYHLAKNDTLSAIMYAETANDLALGYTNSGDMLEPLKMLSEIEAEDKAVHYAKQYIHISDSLQQEERAIRNQFARIRFETDEIVLKNKKISRRIVWLYVLCGVLFSFGGMIYVIYKQRGRNNKLRFEQMQQKSNEEIYNLMISQQYKLEEGRHQEKQRVSRELHDGVLSKLFGTRLSLDSINAKNDNEAIASRERYLEELKNIEKEIRQISHELNAEIYDTSLGYTEVITNLIENQVKIKGIQYQFRQDDDINWELVPNKVKIHLYRILQESLQNINKHSKADNVEVNFKYIDNNIYLAIKDDGVGFSGTKVRDGIGLKNIKSRIKELNGRFNFTSNKGKGTSIDISIAI